MGEMCEGAQKRADFHLGKKTVRSDHYRFLYSVRADCSDCVSFWLRNGADVERGTVNHPRWNAISWAEHFQADRQEIVLNYSLVEFRIFITCCLFCRVSNFHYMLLIMCFFLWFIFLLATCCQGGRIVARTSDYGQSRGWTGAVTPFTTAATFGYLPVLLILFFWGGGNAYRNLRQNQRCQLQPLENQVPPLSDHDLPPSDDSVTWHVCEAGPFFFEAVFIMGGWLVAFVNWGIIEEYFTGDPVHPRILPAEILT